MKHFRNRCLNLSAFLTVLLSASVALAASPRVKRTELWGCEADFGRGGTGTLDFKITRVGAGGSFHGSTEAKGRHHEINGTLEGESIHFTRRLSSTSKQEFKGSAIQVSRGKLSMAGRFAANFQGVWSAECSLQDSVTVSSPPRDNPHRPERGTTDRPRKPVRVPGVRPNTGNPNQPFRPGNSNRPRVRASTSPSSPHSASKVRFIADVSHSAEIAVVQIHVNDRLVETCRRATHCEYVGGPYRAGTVLWRVFALALDNTRTQGRDRKLTISPTRASPPSTRPPRTGTCSISGKATGSKRGSAGIFTVFLSGPRGLSRNAPLKSGSYRFSGLPDGSYRLGADSKADTLVGASPTRPRVTCRGKAIVVDFELR